MQASHDVGEGARDRDKYALSLSLQASHDAGDLYALSCLVFVLLLYRLVLSWSYFYDKTKTRLTF